MHSDRYIIVYVFVLIQMHQVCLARVLLKRPKILCLDEATASLDAKTEALFQKVLETSFTDSTIVCIAHRIDTLRWCRTRIEMSQGKMLSMNAVEAHLERKPSGASDH